MGTITAELYVHPKLKCFRARVGSVSNTGHHITEDSGRFTVKSIITKDAWLCRDNTRADAEDEIAREWADLVSRHTPQTSREHEQSDFEATSIEQRVALSQLRNHLADVALRPLLKPGDRIRATKAECCAHEANFTYSHFYGGWIISNGGASIAPGSVYSINGKVFRV
ncbi:hypothetical protein GGQ73_001836 [Rhizobium skierniewicense]|uniref:Uncharacterized protein n=1 Tax=Rhizobium skierniewicense TaxID=984260 RepID=A0A7W6CET8_9HYPH|nr:hypothetical protein [Rhizobium skierniewicense]MBB3945901.1 hypothetical protein [Rhizobium skierniewicense]